VLWLGDSDNELVSDDVVDGVSIWLIDMVTLADCDTDADADELGVPDALRSLCLTGLCVTLADNVGVTLGVELVVAVCDLVPERLGVAVKVRVCDALLDRVIDCVFERVELSV